MLKIVLPEPSLVALVGPSGCGKSTFARRHFRPTEILSSDFFRGVVVGRSYLCLPTLDALAPPLAAMRELVKQVAAWPGTAYVHCAAGHGRSALVAAAVLLARGLAADPKEAQRLVRKARPGVSLNKSQRRLLELLVPEHPAAGPGP